MIEFGSMTDKFSETGQKVVRRAIEVSKSRDHNFLSLLHILMALAELEGPLLVEAMQAVGVDPNSVTLLLEEELAKSPVHVGPKMAIPEPTRDLFNRALRRARSQGRQHIESYDLFASLFADLNGTPAEILRRLGVGPALATEAISQLIRPREQQEIDALLSQMPQPQRGRAREEQATSIFDFRPGPGESGGWIQIFNFSEITPESLNSVVTIEEKGVTPELWDKIDVNLTGQELQRVESIVSSFLNRSVAQMNEATIFSRAIYPLLVMAEKDRLETWAQSPLNAQYSCFALKGIADAVIGFNISGITKSSFYLIVLQAKLGMQARNLQGRLYAAMLAAARLNWERDKRLPQEIFGCYTIADNWTFARGLVSDIEAARPTMTVASSREYAEKIEAEAILRILKSITGKYAQDLADGA
jgi:Clp amino terminal domain, pathogenicity island component